MAAADALAILVDPDNLVQNTVTIPEGLRVVDVVDLLAKETDFTRRREFEQVAGRARARSACPTTPRATPRATSSRRPTTSGPRTTPETMLTAHGRPLGAGGRGRRPRERRGRARATRPAELMTVASLVEAEAPRRRHAQGRPGHLQPAREPRRPPDQRAARRSTPPSTTRSDDELGVALDRRRTSSSTRRTTPTRTPGCRRLRSRRPVTRRSQAAANPADGDWYYYVTVNLAHRRDQVRRDLRRVPAVQGRSSQDYCENSPTPAEALAMKCAVLGDPIAHSLSPVLHRAGVRRGRAGLGVRRPSGARPAGSATFLAGLGRRRGAGCR